MLHRRPAASERSSCGWDKPGASSPFRLLGQYADEETGLCYVRFRYFDAEAGRWCSPDPLGMLGGKNLVGFGFSPQHATDPLGLACAKQKPWSRAWAGFKGFTDRLKARYRLWKALGDPVVAAELLIAWIDSNPNAKSVPVGMPGSAKMEQGGYILRDKATGEYSTVRVPPGTRDGLPLPPPPTNSHTELIGWFHTHPNTASEGYDVNPSGADKNVSNHFGVPGVVDTHEGRKIFH